MAAKRVKFDPNKDEFNLGKVKDEDDFKDHPIDGEKNLKENSKI